MGPAEAHRDASAAFSATVDSVDPAAWDDPAPPEGWVARDIVRHLVEWFPEFLVSSTGIELPAGPSVDDDPAGAWHAQADAVQALLDDPAVAEQVHEFLHMGSMTLGAVVQQIYVGDVFMHRWDLGRATGQDVALDEATCAEMLAAMEPMDEALRTSGHYGPKVPVADDASAQERLMAFIGRDPHWTP